MRAVTVNRSTNWLRKALPFLSVTALAWYDSKMASSDFEEIVALRNQIEGLSCECTYC